MRASVGVNPGLDSLCPIEMLLPLPPHLSIEPPPCAICPLPAGRWRRGRGQSVHRGIRWKTPQRTRGRNNSKLLFLQTKRFCFADGRKYRAGNVDSELLDRKLVDEIQRGSNYSRCCSYIRHSCEHYYTLLEPKYISKLCIESLHDKINLGNNVCVMMKKILLLFEKFVFLLY